MTFVNSFQVLCMVLILAASILWTVVIFKEEARRPLFGKESLGTGWEMFGFLNIPFIAIPLAFLCGVPGGMGAVIAIVLYSLLGACFILDIKFIHPYHGEHRKKSGYY